MSDLEKGQNNYSQKIKIHQRKMRIFFYTKVGTLDFFYYCHTLKLSIIHNCCYCQQHSATTVYQPSNLTSVSHGSLSLLSTDLSVIYNPDIFINLMERVIYFKFITATKKYNTNKSNFIGFLSIVDTAVIIMN